MNKALRGGKPGFFPGIVFLALALPGSAVLAAASAQKNGQPSLADILKRAAAYCQKLESASLYYVCEEDISEKINFQTGTGTGISSLPGRSFNTWVYDYQLIRMGAVFTERRDLLKKNGRAMKVTDAELETRRFSHKFVIFGPVGLFGGKCQRNFHYEFVKEEPVNRAMAYVIDVTPGPTAPPRALYGRAWLKADDSSVLEIQWDQASMENFLEIQRAAAEIETRPQIVFVSEYAFEKNGLRFPSHYAVEESYVRENSVTPRARSITTVIYKNYRFFTVEVDVRD